MEPYRPTGRVLAVLEMLQARRRVTGAEIAGRLEVSPRTARRYVETLREMGVPVEGERGRGGVLGGRYDSHNRQRATGNEALAKVRDLDAAHGTAEQQERLTRIMGGPVPTPNRLPVEHATYQAEALAILFEMVTGHIEATSKPRPRGRPRKDAAA